MSSVYYVLSGSFTHGLIGIAMLSLKLRYSLNVGNMEVVWTIAQLLSLTCIQHVRVSRNPSWLAMVKLHQQLPSACCTDHDYP